MNVDWSAWRRGGVAQTRISIGVHLLVNDVLIVLFEFEGGERVVFPLVCLGLQVCVACDVLLAWLGCMDDINRI